MIWPPSTTRLIAFVLHIYVCKYCVTPGMVWNPCVRAGWSYARRLARRRLAVIYLLTYSTAPRSCSSSGCLLQYHLFARPALHHFRLHALRAFRSLASTYAYTHRDPCALSIPRASHAGSPSPASNLAIRNTVRHKNSSSRRRRPRSKQALHSSLLAGLCVISLGTAAHAPDSEFGMHRRFVQHPGSSAPSVVLCHSSLRIRARAQLQGGHMPCPPARLRLANSDCCTGS
ncbi:hypothetical protein FKP32DRAFT_53118 [Trametes sanguinea]|nr:hypothetical protein FKP32DRAFT_53118 [Trametes sanguinea]